MNTYVVGIPTASGVTLEKTVQADSIEYQSGGNTMDFYIKPGEEDDDQDDILVASFAWGAGMYILKKESNDRTNSASA